MTSQRGQTELMLLSIRPSFRPALELQLVTRESPGEMSHLLVCQFAGDPDESWEVPLESSVVASLLSGLEAVRVAPVPERVSGLDGTSYYFTVKRGVNQFSLRWWAKLPTAWEPLNPLLRRLVFLAGERASDVHIA